MKVALLAGGRGTRLAGTGSDSPKPLALVGDRPILWHIMRCYRHFGCNDFIVALGHRGEEIADHFRDAARRTTSLEVASGDTAYAGRELGDDGWRVRLVDTGRATKSGGRLKRLRAWLDDGTFMLTWSDGLSNVNIDALVAFHREHGRLATVTAVHPPSRFGRLVLNGQSVTRFEEKEIDRDRWINGAFFVLEPEVLDYIGGDEDPFEGEPLRQLAADGQLQAYRHEGFWQCMDVASERRALDALWQQGKAPWKSWS